MEGLDLIINTLLYCLYLVLFIGTLILGFVQPLVAFEFMMFMTGPIMILAALWLLITGWDFLMHALGVAFTIMLNGIGVILGGIATFLTGLGNAAWAILQGWCEAALAAFLTPLIESSIALLVGIGIGLDALSASFQLISSVIQVALEISLAILLGIGYVFGNIAIITINVVASVILVATKLTAIAIGIGPDAAPIIAGGITLVAFPWIIKWLITVCLHLIHQISAMTLYLSAPIWRSSWILGWIVKMYVACLMLVFEIERNKKFRPAITLVWRDDKLVIA